MRDEIELFPIKSKGKGNDRVNLKVEHQEKIRGEVKGNDRKTNTSRGNISYKSDGNRK